MINSLETATKAGLDVSLIEENLRLTPDKRLLQHQLALDMLEQLQSAYHAKPKHPDNDQSQQPPPETV